MSKKLIVLGVLLLGFMLVLAACGSPAPAAPTQAPAQPTQAPAQAQPTEPPKPTDVPKPTEAPMTIPHMDAFVASGHADAKAMAFNDWNEANPPEVPTACARCHTSAGFQEFVATGKVAKGIPAPAGTFECTTCHNDATKSLSSVTFPGTDAHPGAELTGLGGEATCIVCHQGRESKITVDAAIEGKDADTVVPELGFINIHYFAAAGTQYGAQVASGEQYDGKLYDMKFTHTEGLTTCQSCHDQSRIVAMSFCEPRSW